jgi:hypothetical protein
VLNGAEGLSQKEREQIIRLARKEARQLVAQHWSAIEKVAAASLERGRLSEKI